MTGRAILLVQYANAYLLLERAMGAKDPALARESTINGLRIVAADLGFATDEIRSAVENAIRKATA